MSNRFTKYNLQDVQLNSLNEVIYDQGEVSITGRLCRIYEETTGLLERWQLHCMDEWGNWIYYRIQYRLNPVFLGKECFVVMKPGPTYGGSDPTQFFEVVSVDCYE
jgi:hypothetical protein